MQRTAIVVSKSLAPGEVANATAIIMGQLAQRSLDLYGQNELRDKDDVVHAAIAYNVVILRARPAQMTKFIDAVRGASLSYCAFGSAGRSLSNSFNEYAKLVESSNTEDLQVIAAGATGDDEAIRLACQGLSVYAPQAEQS